MARGNVLATRTGIYYEKIGEPSFTTLVLHLNPGQKVEAEPGAMMYMHRTINLETKVMGKGLGAALFGGETFRTNTYTATTGPGDLALVAPGVGDIQTVELDGSYGLIVESGAYLASTPGLSFETKWQGLKGFLAERDIIMLYIRGVGTVWLAGFGALMEKNLAPNEVLSVDNGHLIAWPDNIRWEVRKVGGWKATLLSGEGLVVDFVGPGKIYMQTRHLPSFAGWVSKFIRR
ncbi:MAG: TIGR00266 family protein [Candidatus Thermoplasmatota archaeon]